MGTSNAALAGATTPDAFSWPTPTPATKSIMPTDAGAASGSSLLGTLGVGAAGVYNAYNAGQQVNSAIAPVTQAAGAMSGAGNTYLSSALSGQLTPAQQQTVNTLNQQGATLNAQAQPEILAGQQGLTAYQQGQLPAWQQQQLDQQTAAAIAQARASMGSNVDSSSMAAVEANIQNQAMMAKGQMLQSNLAVTQQLFNAGITNEKDAFALYDQANTFVTQSLQQDFNNALSSFQFGSEASLNALKAKLTSDQMMGETLSTLLGNLTKSTALGAAQGSGGNIVTALKNMFGGSSGGYTGADIAAANQVGAGLVGTSTSAPADWLAANTPSGSVQDFSSYMGDAAAPTTDTFDITGG